MATTIKMPQLGESVTEGTIERWLVKEGDRVDQYDPLFEVVTDKVNAEVPAEVAGTVTRIIVGDGQTVKVGTPLAEIDAGDGAGADAAAAESADGSMPAQQPAPPVAPEPAPEPEPVAASAPAAEPEPAQQAAAVSSGPATDASLRMTPAVRRLVREHDLDITADQRQWQWRPRDPRRRPRVRGPGHRPGDGTAGARRRCSGSRCCFGSICSARTRAAAARRLHRQRPRRPPSPRHRSRRPPPATRRSPSRRCARGSPPR